MRLAIAQINPTVGALVENRHLIARAVDAPVAAAADPLLLPRNSQALFLVQGVRDEAHRFALSHHRTPRRRSGITSRLDPIQGSGPARRKALLQAFGDLEGLRSAGIGEIEGIRGINRKLAERVKTEIA